MGTRPSTRAKATTCWCIPTACTSTSPSQTAPPHATTGVCVCHAEVYIFLSSRSQAPIIGVTEYQDCSRVIHLPFACRILTFRIDQSTGLLTFANSVDSFGRDPSALTHDPQRNLMWVANTLSKNIVGYRINSTTGLLLRNVCTLKTLAPTPVPPAQHSTPKIWLTPMVAISNLKNSQKMRFSCEFI